MEWMSAFNKNIALQNWDTGLYFSYGRENHMILLAMGKRPRVMPDCLRFRRIVCKCC